MIIFCVPIPPGNAIRASAYSAISRLRIYPWVVDFFYSRIWGSNPLPSGYRPDAIPSLLIRRKLLGGFEPPSPDSKSCMIDRYTTGVFYAVTLSPLRMSAVIIRAIVRFVCLIIIGFSICFFCDLTCVMGVSNAARYITRCSRSSLLDI